MNCLKADFTYRKQKFRNISRTDCPLCLVQFHSYYIQSYSETKPNILFDSSLFPIEISLVHLKQQKEIQHFC